MTFTRVLVMVAITAAAVYLGLNFLLPKHAKESAAAGVTSDQVFGSTAAPAGAPAAASTDSVATEPVGAPPSGEAAKPAEAPAPAPTETAAASSPAPAPEPAAAASSPAPAPEPATAASSPAPTPEPAAAEPAAPAFAPPIGAKADAAAAESGPANGQPASEGTKVAPPTEAPLSAEDARKIADAVRKGASVAPVPTQLAEAPAPAPKAAPGHKTAPAPKAEPAPAPAPAAAPAKDALSADEARKIAENVSREVATRVAETSPPPAAESSAPASSSGGELTEADVRRIATEVARQVLNEKRGGHAAAAPALTASAAPKPHAGATGAASAGSGGGAGHTVHSKGLPSDALRAWWPTGSAPAADKLNLLFAGQASTEKAIVLSFSSDVDPAAAGGQIKLSDSHGAMPKGSWTAGNNAHVLVFKVSKLGRYTLVLKPDLADTSGKKLGSGLHGPVYIQ